MFEQKFGILEVGRLGLQAAERIRWLHYCSAKKMILQLEIARQVVRNRHSLEGLSIVAQGKVVDEICLMGVLITVAQRKVAAPKLRVVEQKATLVFLWLENSLAEIDRSIS